MVAYEVLSYYRRTVYRDASKGETVGIATRRPQDEGADSWVLLPTGSRKSIFYDTWVDLVAAVNEGAL